LLFAYTCRYFPMAVAKSTLLHTSNDDSATQMIACPMFCRTRSCSRSWDRHCLRNDSKRRSEGGRKASPLLLRSHPWSLPEYFPRIRDAAFWREDPVPCRCRQGRISAVYRGCRRGCKSTASDSRRSVLAVTG
jgi:hypothetical protein